MCLGWECGFIIACIEDALVVNVVINLSLLFLGIVLLICKFEECPNPDDGYESVQSVNEYWTGLRASMSNPEFLKLQVAFTTMSGV